MVLIISKQTQTQFPVIRSGVYQNFSVLGSYYEIILHAPEQIYNIGSELHIFLKVVSATLIRTEFYSTLYYLVYCTPLIRLLNSFVHVGHEIYKCSFSIARSLISVINDITQQLIVN